MNYKTLTEEQLQEQLQLIMDEINRRNNLKEIPEQVDSLAKKYEELGGDKEELIHRIENKQYTMNVAPYLAKSLVRVFLYGMKYGYAVTSTGYIVHATHNN